MRNSGHLHFVFLGMMIFCKMEGLILVVKKIIDAHIHFDQYTKEERDQILKEMNTFQIEALISVSTHAQSAIQNLQLRERDQRINVALGYHPEQPLPDEGEMDQLIELIEKHKKEIVAIGEVGLPYYLRRKNPSIPIEPYIEQLEQFVKKAAVYKKPIVLHAIFEDAPLVFDLLEKHSIQKAHFHWFKGSHQIIERLVSNGYYLSITPDLLYDKRIQRMVVKVPLHHIMVETDGPWPFEGPFKNQRTHPKMIHQTILKLGELKHLDVGFVYETIYEQTKKFYDL